MPRRPPYLEAIAVIAATLFLALIIVGAVGSNEPQIGQLSMRPQ